MPFLVASAILGLARLRRARRPAGLARLLSHDRGVAAAWVGVVLLAGVVQGPLPWWDAVPAIGSDERVEQYDVDHHAAVLERAVAMIPDGVPVSAGNLLGGPPLRARADLHLPGRRRRAVGRSSTATGRTWRTGSTGSGSPRSWRSSAARTDMRIVIDEDGVMVFRRVDPVVEPR